MKERLGARLLKRISDFHDAVASGQFDERRDASMPENTEPYDGKLISRDNAIRTEGSTLFGLAISHSGEIEYHAANAAELVRRWNAYPDLLDALSHLHDAVASPNELSVPEAMENAAKVLRELRELGEL